MYYCVRHNDFGGYISMFFLLYKRQRPMIARWVVHSSVRYRFDLPDHKEKSEKGIVGITATHHQITKYASFPEAVYVTVSKCSMLYFCL